MRPWSRGSADGASSTGNLTSGETPNTRQCTPDRWPRRTPPPPESPPSSQWRLTRGKFPLIIMKRVWSISQQHSKVKFKHFSGIFQGGLSRFLQHLTAAVNYTCPGMRTVKEVVLWYEQPKSCFRDNGRRRNERKHKLYGLKMWHVFVVERNQIEFKHFQSTSSKIQALFKHFALTLSLWS